MPAAINMYGEGEQLTAPLASIEDLSRVNTPGGSPSPKPKMRHPALEDPNWEPSEDLGLETQIKPQELTPLQPKEEGQGQEGPLDR